MTSCIIIEDQLPAQRILQKYIGDVNGLELKETFGDAIAALDYLKENTIELIFLDVHLPRLSGMDFLSILPRKPYIILTTAFSDYALQGYEFDVVDYLLKPFSFDRFLKAVLKAQRLLDKFEDIPVAKNNLPDSILVKIGYDRVKININDIVYIKSDGDYTQLQCKDKKHLVSYPLKYWLENLSGGQFLQTHRSFIINTKHIQKISSSSIEINGQTIPIGRVYKKNFQEKLRENN